MRNFAVDEAAVNASLIRALASDPSPIKYVFLMFVSDWFVAISVGVM